MDGRIRVLHVVKSLGLGGTEKVMQFLAAHLDRARFHPAVHSPTDGERRRLLVEAGVEVFVSADLLGCLARFRPHIVHVHRAGWAEPELMRPIRLAGVGAVVETNVFGRHDPSPSGRVIDLHLFVSRFCAERYAAMHGIYTAGPGYSVLYNPVDTDFYDAFSWTRDFSRPVVGRLSRPDPGKWSRLALDMVPLLARKVESFRYEVVGGTPEAREWVRSRGLERFVSWREPVTGEAALAGFFDSVSLLAHANDTGETFGLAIAEAMAAGLPVVTHPCAWPRDNAQLELVEHGVTGLVAATAEEYAEAVAWLLGNPDQARAMGERGRDKARRLYRVQDQARRLEGLYLGLLQAKGSLPVAFRPERD